MNNQEFRKKEWANLKEKYGIKAGTQLTEKLKGHALWDYMCEFAERYRKQYQEPRHKRELKCPQCDFETEKENLRGLEKHITARHTTNA